MRKADLKNKCDVSMKPPVNEGNNSVKQKPFKYPLSWTLKTAVDTTIYNGEISTQDDQKTEIRPPTFNWNPVLSHLNIRNIRTKISDVPKQAAHDLNYFDKNCTKIWRQAERDIILEETLYSPDFTHDSKIDDIINNNKHFESLKTCLIDPSKDIQLGENLYSPEFDPKSIKYDIYSDLKQIEYINDPSFKHLTDTFFKDAVTTCKIPDEPCIFNPTSNFQQENFSNCKETRKTNMTQICNQHVNDINAQLNSSIEHCINHLQLQRNYCLSILIADNEREDIFTFISTINQSINDLKNVQSMQNFL